MHSVILGLYNDGHSSREIEKILLKKYKKEVSHSYINFYVKEYVINKEDSNV